MGAVYINLDFIEEISRLRLPESTHRVLLMVFAHMGKLHVEGNDVLLMSQSEIARKLNISKSSVGRAIKELVKLNVLDKTTLNGVPLYEVNPDVARTTTD